MPTTMRLADVAEGVRRTIAVYTQALDDGRTDDVVDTFCPDGGVVLPGMGTHRGHQALRDAYSSWVPRRPQRHLVLNTVIAEWSDTEATAISDVLFLLMVDSGWSIQLVGRYEDQLHHDNGVWRFHNRVATFVTASPPPGETS